MIGRLEFKARSHESAVSANQDQIKSIKSTCAISVARSGVLSPKWCSGTPTWCGNFGSGVFIKKGDFSIFTC